MVKVLILHRLLVYYNLQANHETIHTCWFLSSQARAQLDINIQLTIRAWEPFIVTEIIVIFERNHLSKCAESKLAPAEIGFGGVSLWAFRMSVELFGQDVQQLTKLIKVLNTMKLIWVFMVVCQFCFVSLWFVFSIRI